MSNIKTYLSTTLKQCQTSNYLSTTPNNVKHQNLSKYYTQTMSNIKTYPSTTLKQCQTSKTYLSSKLKQCQNIKIQVLSKQSNIKTVKHLPQTYLTSKLIYSQTMSNIQNLSKQCQTTLKTMSTSKLIQVLHKSNNVKHQNIKTCPSATLKQCQTSKLI
ncbi:unnamed protein product [Mytilus edulis]|uniref:Uncharacterized protein n=1 Tax=Mytilus edulis TaxID=6550 RepID=A0A8S3TJT3_MYTED|nr:unnamed protein product [Mytilus edulis]